MAAASSNEFQLIVPKTAESVDVKLGSNFIVPCHLSPEISAVDMEIRWFKETDCVCIYKNRQMTEGRGYENRVNLFTNELQERGDVSLQLKNFKRTDAGLYLCQVTSESTTVKITVQVKEELVVNNIEEFHQKLFKAFRDQSKKLKQTELKLKDLGKTIESKNHELHVKHWELETNKKTQMEMREQLKEMQTKLTNTTKQLKETSIKNKELQMQQLENQLLQKNKDTELENLKTLMNETVKELEASKHQQETLRKRIRNLEMENLKKLMSEKEITVQNTVQELEYQLEKLTEQMRNREKESQIQLLQKNKDNENIQNQLKEKNTELDNLKKLMSEKEFTAQNTVQELEYQLETLTEQMRNRDQGQIQDAKDRIEHKPNSVLVDTKKNLWNSWNRSNTENIKLFWELAGKTNNSHRSFIDTLINQIQDIKEVSTVDESNTFVVFCPIVSPAGTDIEAALKIFNNSTGSSKLNVLVVLHHTFDPEKTVPDSSRCVNRTDILTVDCLFYEDTGLLECQKNHDAMKNVFDWLKKQGKEKGIKVLRKNETESWFSKQFSKPSFMGYNSGASSVVPPNSSSSRKTGDPQHNDCNRVAEKLSQITGLSMISKEGISNIGKIYPVSSQTDYDAAWQDCYNTPDKHVLVLLLPEHVTNVAADRRFKERPNTIVVDCAVSEGEELILLTKLPAVLQLLSTESEQRIPTKGSQQHQETDNEQQNRQDNTSNSNSICTQQ